MCQIKAILFDLDNTLVDFLKIKETACMAAIEAMVKAGLHMPKDRAYELLMKTYFAVGIESDNAFSEFLKSIGEFDHKKLGAAINAYLASKNQNLKAYKNVEDVLNKLGKKDIFLAIVTDAPKTKAYQRLLAIGIEPYFKFVVGFEDTNTVKATGIPLNLAIGILKNHVPGILPHEILMVGDSMERDIIPAKKLGLKTALSLYGQEHLQEGLSDYVFEDISNLLDAVNERL